MKGVKRDNSTYMRKGLNLTEPIITDFGIVGVLTNVVNYCKFGVSIFKGFRLTMVNFGLSYINEKQVVLTAEHYRAACTCWRNFTSHFTRR